MPDVGRQQTAHHAEGGRFSGAVRSQQAEDLAAPDGEADPVGRSEVSEFARQLDGFDHGLVILRSRARALRQHGLPARPAAEHIHEGILESWRYRREPASGPAPNSRGFGGGAPASQHEPDGLALDHAIEHLGRRSACARTCRRPPEMFRTWKVRLDTRAVRSAGLPAKSSWPSLSSSTSVHSSASSR